MMSCPSNLVAQIKERLSAQEVAEAYGFYPNHAGFIACPFHGEKTPSLRFRPPKADGQDGGFHCFGCGLDGDCIDFIRLLFGLTMPAAIVRLNSDFHLGLTADRPDPRELDRMKKERQAREAAEKAYNDECNAQILEYRRLHFARLHKAPAGPDEPFDPEFVEALLRMDRLDYWFSTHPARYSDYVKSGYK